MVLGSALWVTGEITQRRHLIRFGRQNAMWGAVDAAIAIAGRRSRHRRGPLSAAETARKARTLQWTLVANAVADVAYVGAGAHILKRTITTRSESRGSATQTVEATFRGMGSGDGAAIILQGGFLLVLDTVFAARVRHARG